MTTYNEEVGKIQAAALPELYKIRVGGDYIYATSFASTIMFNGQEYTKRPISRSALNYSTKLKILECTVRISITDLTAKYISNQPIEPTEITIYKATNADLNQYVIFFKGNVVGVSVKNRVLNAQCKSNTRVLEKKIPTIIHQSFCNHEVFDSECSLNDEDFKVIGTVTVSDADLSASAFASYEDGYFTGGRAQYENDMRLITNHVGSVITLQVPFDSRVTTGSLVEVFPGCDGSPETCKNKFNNLDNFLGMPYIPTSNPVLWGVV